MSRWLAVLYRFEDVFGFVLFSTMTLVVLTQVIVRFLLYRWLSIAWADEVGRALLVWVSFWGAVMVTRAGDHIAIEVLYERASRQVQWLLRILSDFLVGAFLVLLIWKGLPIFLESFVRRTSATGMPTFIFDGALWIGCLLMLFHLLVNAWRRWRPAATGAPLHNPWEVEAV